MLLSERPALAAPLLLNLFQPHPAQSSAYNLDPMHQQSNFLMSPSAVGGRFQPLMAAVRQRFGKDLALLQVWTLISGQKWSNLARKQLSGVVAQTHNNPCTLEDPGLLAFRNACCKNGIRGPAMGMVGKAWSSGALCVVQNAETLPQMLHPRTKLECLDSVAELVYIPVFDHTIPDTEVQAVLEVILSKHAVDPMAVANAITFISGFLGTLQMSLSHPIRYPQQQQQQALGGFGASPFQHQSHQQPQQQQQQRSSELRQQQAPTTQVGRPSAAAATNVGQLPSPQRTLSRTMSRSSSIRNLGTLEDLEHAMSC